MIMGRLEKLEARRLDPLQKRAGMLTEVYERITDSEHVRYAVGAMQPIDETYTENTFAEGDRVKNQLDKGMAVACEYRYQGSTTNDTHIRAHSDIDLLVLTKKFFWVRPPLSVTSPYVGDERADMREIRVEATSSLKDAFRTAKVNDENPKAIRIEEGSLRRHVDVVPASWVNTADYVNTNSEVYRGVRIFDNNTGEFPDNMPFLYNDLIDKRDIVTYGGMRKAARLMKSVNYDFSTVQMSSFNLTSIAWNIPSELIAYTAPHELRILDGCCDYCVQLGASAALRDLLKVPDGTRGVFEGKAGATLEQLSELGKQLWTLRAEIIRDKHVQALTEARTDYPSPLQVRTRKVRMPAFS
jgi:hypothetical protein